MKFFITNRLNDFAAIALVLIVCLATVVFFHALSGMLDQILNNVQHTVSQAHSYVNYISRK